MDKEKIYWMNYSINIANNTKHGCLCVGAVLVTKDNQLVCSAYTGEYLDLSWYKVLVSKIRKQNINNVYCLFLTVNTLFTDSEFDLNKLLEDIKVEKIYLGVPDPNLSHYLLNDPVSSFKKIHRYPDSLQKKILQQNFEYYKNSKQNIISSPYYFSKRISNLVLEKLREKNIFISKEELSANRQIDKLIQLIVTKYKLGIEDAKNLVDNAISKSFDEKYSTYNYSIDVRSLNVDWEKNFLFVCNSLIGSSMEYKNVLNVGVGSGNEAIQLFSKYKKVTFVDIATSGLNRIKKEIPHSNIVVSRAENLLELSSNRYDVYVSLRTYNSSFFDISKALSEAYRVLKNDGVVIISIANGFLCLENQRIIPGLIIPGTEFVDIYRGFDMIKNLYVELINKGFINIQFFPTVVELFISAKVKK